MLLGGPGTDTLDGGAGDNVLIDGENLVAGLAEGDEWLAEPHPGRGWPAPSSTPARRLRHPAADLADA